MNRFSFLTKISSWANWDSCPSTQVGYLSLISCCIFEIQHKFTVKFPWSANRIIVYHAAPNNSEEAQHEKISPKNPLKHRAWYGMEIIKDAPKSSKMARKTSSFLAPVYKWYTCMHMYTHTHHYPFWRTLGRILMRQNLLREGKWYCGASVTMRILHTNPSLWFRMVMFRMLFSDMFSYHHYLLLSHVWCLLAIPFAVVDLTLLMGVCIWSHEVVVAEKALVFCFPLWLSNLFKVCQILF